MTAPGTVAQQIVDDIKALVEAATTSGPPENPDALNLAVWTAVITRIRNMVTTASVTSNVTVVVQTTDAGLQRIPAAPVSEFDPCAGPETNKNLSGTAASTSIT